MMSFRFCVLFCLFIFFSISLNGLVSVFSFEIHKYEIEFWGKKNMNQICDTYLW